MKSFQTDFESGCKICQIFILLTPKWQLLANLLFTTFSNKQYWRLFGKLSPKLWTGLKKECTVIREYGSDIAQILSVMMHKAM